MNELLKQTGLCSDQELIQRVLNGETALFEILIRRCNPVLYKIARSYGFNHHDTEDLMQETHVSAFQQLGQFENRAAYKTWIAKIIINKCLYKRQFGYFKYETPGMERISEAATPTFSTPDQAITEKTVMNRELSRALEASLQQLPFSYRCVFVLRKVEGFSVAETAELLGISPVNVKVRFSRAKALLQKQLEHLYSTTDLYEFNLVYCDAIVKKVFERIGKTNPE
jgi:RNA polymerase sigma factor (sigma-70 family)